MGRFAFERGAAPGLHLRARSILASSLLLVAGLVLCAPVHAVSLANPIIGTPSFSLGDARFQALSESAGDYSVSFPAADNSGFVNGPGGLLAVNVQVDFAQVGSGTTLEFGGSQLFANAMLVLTTVRLGAPTGSVSCPIPGSLPLAPAGFVQDSVGGDASGPAFLVSDPAAGFVCDDEGDILLGIPLDAAVGSPSTLRFDLELQAAIDDPVYLQYKAFLVVPEPATAFLVVTGMGLLSAGRRRLR